MLKSVRQQGSQCLIHVAVSPVGTTKGITHFGPAVTETEIEQSSSPDQNTIGVQGQSPLHHRSALVALLNFLLQFDGFTSIDERGRTPVTHHLWIGKDRVKTIDVVFTNPA